ncbi:MAG: neutral zinc metallopeptidase [Oscillatoriales cyanobacterium C42_A2020_001]|nr:neutral zinc metallopeptidase [Leptolyngbyaceae cyanobacterium C42_A2020_001]
MRWEFGRRSDNVEDRRGSRVAGPVVGGGIGAILLALVVSFLGGDPSIILDQAANNPPASNQPSAGTPPSNDKTAQFVSTVLADTEDTWNQIFREQLGADYQEPKLVLFSSAVKSACGYAQAAAGPFYCPRDEKVYIDLDFFRQLSTRHQAPGDFAQAYVIAHEVGHHVQKELGVLGKVNKLQQQVSETQGNQLQVRVELQADCLAGVWAHHTQNSQNVQLEQGDVEEGLNAASQIGDDTLQKQARGYVVPESFTHGSSAQRVRWFQRGIQTGDIRQCDTFNARSL